MSEDIPFSNDEDFIDETNMDSEESEFDTQEEDDIEDELDS